MTNLEKTLREKIIVIDGAMGTMLQEYGLPAGWCPEEWNLSHPEIPEKIHQAYFQAGADITTANTFGAIPLKLAEYGLAHQVREINLRGIAIAKKVAANYGGWVAGSMGPLGKLLQPLGDLTFDAAFEQFRIQVRLLQEAGADLILIETIGDLGELRAAIVAAVENFDGPVIASMTFENTGKMFTGTDPETAAVVAERLGVTAMGVNCSVGPQELVPIVRKLALSTNLPILVSPNAGMPEIIQDKTVYRTNPETMANYAQQFIKDGAGLVGSCCGSTPEHTKAIAAVARNFKPEVRQRQFGLRVASRSQIVTIHPELLPVVIGERINPTGRKNLSEEIRKGSTEAILREVVAQTEAGAEILDVNMGVPEIDETEAMRKALNSIQALSNVPVMIDSTDPEVIEEALKTYHGKVLINSVNGEESSLGTLLPLAKRYGAAVLGLTLDEKGLPKTAEERLTIARRIIERAEKYGIPREDIIIDCLVLTVSAQPEAIPETLKAVARVKKELGVVTSLGVSNVSFGLPCRSSINIAFYAMALRAGLDAAIINPLDEKMMEIHRAASVLTGRDQRAENYIAYEKQRVEQVAPRQEEGPREESNTAKVSAMKLLYNAVLSGDKDNVVSYVEKALQEAAAPLKIFNEGLIPGIEEVGRRYEAGTYFLPQLILAGETMTRSFERLKPEMEKNPVQSLGTVVLATVKGDIHDIGKNILAVLLANHGFKVINLGKNVETEKIVEAAVKEQADIIGLSALMTTTMLRMPEMIELVKERQLPFKIMVGGAAVTQSYAEKISADGYAVDAVKAVEVAKRLVGGNG